MISNIFKQNHHIRFHKFNHYFKSLSFTLDTLNPICSCGTVETTLHYLLYCPNFSNERLTLFHILQNIDGNISSKDDSNTSKMFLFGKQ